jgi:hypothetical protein
MTGNVAPIQRVERKMVWERGGKPHMAEMWVTFHTYGRQLHDSLENAERHRSAQYELGR